MNQPIYVPLQSLDDWQCLLAKPDLHWREGFSAALTARAWHTAVGFPAPIAAAFLAADEPFSSLAPLIIIPEHQVPLPPLNGRPAQPDVWVLASHSHGTASISVEAKVAESFGPTLDEWFTTPTPGKRTRLAYLTELLGLPAELPGSIRYQLLHRTASAVIEAQRFRANTALCLVQSFSPAHIGLSDFQSFAGLFGQQPERGQFVSLFQRDGIDTYLAWVHHAPPVSPETPNNALQRAEAGGGVSSEFDA